MRMWGGRFDEGPDARMADFTRSIDVDSELALDDIAGSIAHVRGLGRAGLLTEDEVATLQRGLVSLRADVEAGAIASWMAPAQAGKARRSRTGRMTRGCRTWRGGRTRCR